MILYVPHCKIQSKCSKDQQDMCPRQLACETWATGCEEPRCYVPIMKYFILMPVMSNHLPMKSLFHVLTLICSWTPRGFKRQASRGAINSLKLSGSFCIVKKKKKSPKGKTAGGKRRKFINITVSLGLHQLCSTYLARGNYSCTKPSTP